MGELPSRLIDPNLESYDAVRAAFRWPVPERFNIAVSVCDRHADDPAAAGREALIHEAEERRVVVVDLLGPLIMRVAQRLHVEPRHQPGLLHGFSDDYFERDEAVEYALRHDDGANLRTLHEADIVLTCDSRTSKTPL